MKGILVAFLLLGSMCYGQKSENYVLKRQTWSNDKPIASNDNWQPLLEEIAAFN